MHVLLVKTSSLGDLIHTLPALTDAVAARPDVQFDWVAERPFADIPAWHPAVSRVIVSDLRQFRRQPFSLQARSAHKRLRAEISTVDYDCVVDAQGLLKSAWLARQAGRPVSGPDWHSAREAPASLFYKRRYTVPSRHVAHAIERNRRLFSQALDYPIPATPPDAGLDARSFPAPSWKRSYVLLLHGTSWATKCWPEANWIALAHWLAERGLDALLPWGTEAERISAERIAEASLARVLPRQELTAMAGWLACAHAFVGVDTGLAHLGAAVGTPGVTLYGPTLPHLTGALGLQQVQLADPDASRIDRQRKVTVSVNRVIDALARTLDDLL